MARLAAQRRNVVYIEIEGRRREQLEVAEAHLFAGLTARGREQIRIIGVDVATGLQPAA
jgi:hypothetical protein